MRFILLLVVLRRYNIYLENYRITNAFTLTAYIRTPHDLLGKN